MGKTKGKPLTVKRIEQAKHAGRGYTTLADGNGLQLRVFASGTKTWYFRYTSPQTGRIRCKPVGVYGNHGQGIGLAEARQNAAGFRVQISNGEDPFPPEKTTASKQVGGEPYREPDGPLVFDEALDEFESYLCSRRETTGPESIRAIRKDILPLCRGLPVTEINRGLLVKGVEVAFHRGAKRGAGKLFNDLKQMFSWLEFREDIGSNPLRYYKASDLIGPQVERDRFLEADEAVLLLKALPSSGLTTASQLAILLILATGFRLGELRQARWAFVDFEKRLLTLPSWLTKPRVEHRIHLSLVAIRCLEALYRETGHSNWLFPSPAKADAPISKAWLTKHVSDRQIGSERQLKKRAKSSSTLVLPRGKWTPHDLRRTVASTMARLGVFPEIIERTLNHQEENRMKRIYNRYNYSPEKMKAWDLMGEELERWLRESRIHGLDVISRLEVKGREVA